jgi:hypothetical protein
VARKLRYRSPHEAERDVRKWLYNTNEKRSKDWTVSREKMHADAVNAECDRLDALQASYWAEALGGHVASAMVVLKIIAQRARLLGLETATPNVTANLNTLVVGGSEQEYIAALARAQASLGPAKNPRVIEANDDPGVVD